MRISDWSSDVCSSDLLTQSDRGTLTLGNVMLLAEGIGGSGGIGGTGQVGDPGGAAFGGTTQAGSFLGDGDGLTLAGSASFGTLDLSSDAEGGNRDRKSTRLNSSH